MITLTLRRSPGFDPRLLRLLQYARRGEYAYGRTPSVDVATMSAGIASMHGRSADLVNPEFIKRLDCSFVHGSVGGLDSSCEVNALKRWLRGFLDAFAIYLPVRTRSTRGQVTVLNVLLLSAGASRTTTALQPRQPLRLASILRLAHPPRRLTLICLPRHLYRKRLRIVRCLCVLSPHPVFERG